MGEKVRFDISRNIKLLQQISLMQGVAMAAEALPAEGSQDGKYPGVGLARARVECVLANERAVLSSEVLKHVARTGAVDITQVKSVHTLFEDGQPLLEAEMYDLADMAEGG